MAAGGDGRSHSNLEVATRFRLTAVNRRAEADVARTDATADAGQATPAVTV
jgi:hypothetical protein